MRLPLLLFFIWSWTREDTQEMQIGFACNGAIEHVESRSFFAIDATRLCLRSAPQHDKDQCPPVRHGPRCFPIFLFVRPSDRRSVFRGPSARPPVHPSVRFLAFQFSFIRLLVIRSSVILIHDQSPEELPRGARLQQHLREA